MLLIFDRITEKDVIQTYEKTWCRFTRFNNHIRYCWFLTELLKKMWFKLMKKHDVDLQNLIIMIFNRLYKDRLKKTQKIKWEHNFEKKNERKHIQKIELTKEKVFKKQFY